MQLWRKLQKRLQPKQAVSSFLSFLGGVEETVAIVLSIALLVVIVVAVADLGVFLFRELIVSPSGGFTRNLFRIFGLFLNVLIALEILENITAYLKKHLVQMELVISTALVAVARKIIILDLEKTTGIDLIALAAAILSLSVSYWLVRRSNASSPPGH